MDLTKFIEALRKGESQTIEFCQAIHKDMAKDICAFLNTEGGTLVLGADNNGEIIGISDRNKSEQEISNIINALVPAPIEIKLEVIDLNPLGKKELWAFLLEIPKADKLYSYRHIVYIRAGKNVRPLTISELIEKASESLLILFDEQTTRIDKGQISRGMVEKYLELREKKRGIKNNGFSDECLQQLKITKKDKATNGGLLFFSEDPQKHIPYARVRLILFDREDIKEYSDYKEFNGTIWKILENLEHYFLSNLRVFGGELAGFQREEYLEYPILALREALANALVHRNYFDPTEIFIIIYPNRLIIRNPGAFPAGVNVDNPIHKPRNPLLSTYLYDMGYIEKWGSGIKKIREACSQHPFVKVEFKTTSYTTEVVFFKDTKKAFDGLDDMSKEILSLLEDKILKSGAICKLTKKSKPTVVSKINILLAYGLIRKIGSGPKLAYTKIK